MSALCRTPTPQFDLTQVSNVAKTQNQKVGQLPTWPHYSIGQRGSYFCLQGIHSPLIGGVVSPPIISIFLLVFLLYTKLYTVYFGVNHCLISCTNHVHDRHVKNNEFMKNQKKIIIFLGANANCPHLD